MPSAPASSRKRSTSPAARCSLQSSSPASRAATRLTEDSGSEAIVCTEVNNDAVGTAQLMGLATRHIKVGTWVADIYLRVPYLCAKSAIIIAAATGVGRSSLKPTMVSCTSSAS